MKDQKIQYYKIFNNPNIEEEDIATTLNLDLSDEIVLRFLSTAKPHDERSEKFQFLFRNNKSKDSMFVMTWDLELNQEYSLV